MSFLRRSEPLAARVGNPHTHLSFAASRGALSAEEREQQREEARDCAKSKRDETIELVAQSLAQRLKDLRTALGVGIGKVIYAKAGDVVDVRNMDNKDKKILLELDSGKGLVASAITPFEAGEVVATALVLEPHESKQRAVNYLLEEQKRARKLAFGSYGIDIGGKKCLSLQATNSLAGLPGMVAMIAETVLPGDVELKANVFLSSELKSLKSKQGVSADMRDKLKSHFAEFGNVKVLELVVKDGCVIRAGDRIVVDYGAPFAVDIEQEVEIVQQQQQRLDSCYSGQYWRCPRCVQNSATTKTKNKGGKFCLMAAFKAHLATSINLRRTRDLSQTCGGMVYGKDLATRLMNL